MAALEAAMADPEQADAMDDLVTRYGEAQGRFQELGGYELEARAREVLAGLSLVIKTSKTPAKAVCGAPVVVGKLVEVVLPAT